MTAVYEGVSGGELVHLKAVVGDLDCSAVVGMRSVPRVGEAVLLGGLAWLVNTVLWDPTAPMSPRIRVYLEHSEDATAFAKEVGMGLSVRSLEDD